jgi:23S rRNA pseudouridine1911/1915/1917 synthase
MIDTTFKVAAEQEGVTLAAALRLHLPGQTWSQVRRLVAGSRVKVGSDLCLDPARRVHENEVITLLARAVSQPRNAEADVIRYCDEHIVVVEKPAGICTVRHPVERHWTDRRKALSPTLEDLVPRMIARREGRLSRKAHPRLRVVQRIDKDTSGLVVFARTVFAERGLGKQFHAHTVTRRYLAIVPGFVKPQRIDSRLVRDRGDGRRGSANSPGQGKQAITHVDVVERLPRYTLLSCRLETGRTHQIRIHLAELGHPVCGEAVYNKRLDGTVFGECAEAPRLALHATELGFNHPATGEALHWEMPLPEDLRNYLESLRKV